MKTTLENGVLQKRFGIKQEGSRTSLTLENIKCDGCGKTISKNLSDLGLKSIVVDPSSSTVEFDNPADSSKIDEAIGKLRGLGYPLVETAEGVKALALRAKSYLSCAIGRVS